MRPRVWVMALLAALVPLVAGCARREVNTAYGRSSDHSINGTGALVRLFRAQGHEVRTAVRLSDELADWADVIVRFSPYPGPPDREEADWFLGWLNQIGERKMIYVVRDYNAESDYWQAVLDQLPKSGEDKLRTRAKGLRDEAGSRARLRQEWAKEVAQPEEWFAVNRAKPGQGPTACQALDGPWSIGVDPGRSQLPRHETLEANFETVLLTGDGKPLVMEWSYENQSQVLVAANASFLVNGGLLNPARRPLAMETVYWIGDEPLNVAFVEGRYLLAGPPSAPSVFELLKIWPFGWVVAQLMVLGLVACLARAPRLGRPRPEHPTGEDRPAAHPEALGSLLARAGDADAARTILETYRRWRNPTNPSRGGSPPHVAPVDSTEKPLPL